MGETTTIQITTEQRDELTARKTYDDEPIKAVVGRLLEQETGEVDYAEIERRCERAVEHTLEARR
jgi:hypothetical protein